MLSMRQIQSPSSSISHLAQDAHRLMRCSFWGSGTSFQQRPYFLRGQLAPLAGLQIAQCNRADGDTHQSQRRVAYSGSHAPHLPVFPLADDESHPRCRDVLPEADRDGARREIGFLRYIEAKP